MSPCNVYFLQLSVYKTVRPYTVAIFKNVIPMCSYDLQATQKQLIIKWADQSNYVNLYTMR